MVEKTTQLATRQLKQLRTPQLAENKIKQDDEAAYHQRSHLKHYQGQTTGPKQRSGARKPRDAFKNKWTPKATTSQAHKGRFSPANPSSTGGARRTPQRRERRPRTSPSRLSPRSLTPTHHHPTNGHREGDSHGKAPVTNAGVLATNREHPHSSVAA